jgi:tripartite ATP-independent transporter DctP family solute receptor
MTNFRKMISFAMLILMMTLLVACGGNETGGNTSDSGTSTNSEEKAKNSGEKVNIKFGHGAVESNSRHEAALKFKSLVEEKSDGQITVEVFPNEVLGSEPQMVQSVEFGDLQMVAASTFAQYNPKVEVFALPFLFETKEKAWSTLDGELGQEVYGSLLDNNLRILAHFENGFRHVTNNKRPIETPEDLKGLKIRTPEMPILMGTFKTLGANPTPMAFGELYMALQQGTVDGQENPITNIYASKFYEVQDYISLTGHSYLASTIAISDKFWKTLTPEQQEIVQSSITEAAQWHRDTIDSNEEQQLAELEKAGMKVNRPNTAAFREAAKDVYKEYENVFGKELIDRVLEAQK